jgi:hypothetical protein
LRIVSVATVQAAFKMETLPVPFIPRKIQGNIHWSRHRETTPPCSPSWIQIDGAGRTTRRNRMDAESESPHAFRS